MSDGDLGDFSMLELFRAEVEGQASVLTNGLVALEDGGDPKLIEPLMRAAHSVKGAARIVGLDAAVEVAHVMEDVLVKAQVGDLVLGSDSVDLLLRGTDVLLQIGQETAETLPGWLAKTAEDRAGLIGALGDVRDGKVATPTNPAPTPVVVVASSPPVEPSPTVISLDDLSMLDLFKAEVEGQTATLNDGLLALEEAENPAEAVKTLMRAAHSVKGAARIVGLEPAVQVAHLMEDCFVAAQEGRMRLESGQIDVLLRGVDVLAKMSAQEPGRLNDWLRDSAGSLQALQRDLETIRDGSVPVAAAKPAPVAPPIPAPGAAASVSAPAERKVEPVRDSAVKVTAESLNRLMGLAAETLVEAKLLEPFQLSLQAFKQNQVRTIAILEKMREHLDEIPGGAPELRGLWMEALSRLGGEREELVARIDELENYGRRSSNLSHRLYREVIASRMRPFNDGVQGFPRLVRDLSRALGKRVKFEILGRNTEVDRDILERLEAPLTHILRNAVDHGLETVEERQAAKKSPESSLRLEARHRAGMLLVSVTDDGRGIPIEKLRQKVIVKKLAPPEMAEKLTEAELLEFLFLPGFSTAEKVTEISGRGVGLDVVQSMVHEAGGTVRIFSTLGKGTTFQLQLPITRSVVRALLVRIGGEPYAFPLARIDHAILVDAESIELVEGRQFIEVEGKNVGLVAAEEILELEADREESEKVRVVVVSDRNQSYGLEVDQFIGERDLVVRPLDPRLGKVPDVSAASLMEDGDPLLILDVDDLIKSIASHLSGGTLGRAKRRDSSRVTKGSQRVLVVDDSITVREVERKLLESNGYEVDVATDGMEGWNAVRLADYDLVISDVDMPRMNGIEFVRRIRQDNRLKSLPVMIVSYKDREEDRLKGMEAGANYYLTKSSFHDETLLEAVRDLIGGHPA
jgi:two-component system sensor histidine kinase and response regulator WspE